MRGGAKECYFPFSPADGTPTIANKRSFTVPKKTETMPDVRKTLDDKFLKLFRGDLDGEGLEDDKKKLMGEYVQFLEGLPNFPTDELKCSGWKGKKGYGCMPGNWGGISGMGDVSQSCVDRLEPTPCEVGCQVKEGGRRWSKRQRGKRGSKRHKKKRATNRKRR